MTIMSICSACILSFFLLLLFKVGKQFLLITQASESNINTGSSTVSDLETVNFTQMVAATVKMWIPALLPPPPQTSQELSPCLKFPKESALLV